MNTQPTTMDEEITGEDLAILSLEELGELILQMYASLEEIFHAAIRYAQIGTQIEDQRVAAIKLEHQFNWVCQCIKAAVDAIIYHTIFGDEGD